VKHKMVSFNPFGEFRVACETALQDVLSRLFPKVSVSVRLDLPPSPEFGELASSVCFEIAKQTDKRPLVVAGKVVEALDVSEFPLVQAVKAAGGGYVNFYADFAKFSRLTVESIRALGRKYVMSKMIDQRKLLWSIQVLIRSLLSTLDRQGTPC